MRMGIFRFQYVYMAQKYLLLLLLLQVVNGVNTSFCFPIFFNGDDRIFVVEFQSVVHSKSLGCDRQYLSNFPQTNQRIVRIRSEFSNFYRKFVKEAAKVNEEQQDITVGVTFFADLTEEEKVQYHGANVTEEVGSITSQG